jgi:hypothetical protein
VYSRYLSDRLQDRLAEAAGLSDRYSCAEELDVVRATTVDVLKLYDETLKLDDTPDNLQKKINAGFIVCERMKEVAAMVNTAIQVEKQRNDVLSVGTLHLVVAQVAELAHDVFGEDQPERVREFANRIQNIRMPSKELEGTVRTPDMDVDDMDSSVPLNDDPITLNIA